MKKFFLIPLTAILLCSCGGLTNITTPNSVALNQGNFRFVKTVTAEVPSLYVFCIGGLSSRATADVVEKLKTSAQLQQNQALADIRIKTTTKLWVFGIVITKKLTATASVVEFIDTSRKQIMQSVSKKTQLTFIKAIQQKQNIRQQILNPLLNKKTSGKHCTKECKKSIPFLKPIL